MKTILAYGDSLTYGHNPAFEGGRHPYDDRWPSALEAGLGGQARVIAEGLGGRTTAYDDFTTDADRNGARILPTLLGSHAPLDLVIFMLGTNDLKPAVNGSARMASFGIRRLVQLTRGHFQMLDEPVPAIIIVAPPILVDNDNADMIGHFGGFEHAQGQSQEFAEHYRRRATELGALFFDASTVAITDPRDGVHLDQANTRAIGHGLVPLAKQALGL